MKFFFSFFSKCFSNFFFKIFLSNFLVMALGFYCGSDAYLRSGWNVLDFSLVVCSIVDTLFVLVSKSSPKILGILRVFRLLRTLRPLRVISRAPGLKLVVQEIVANIFNIQSYSWDTQPFQFLVYYRRLSKKWPTLSSSDEIRTSCMSRE